jgi:hypothetical protein
MGEPFARLHKQAQLRKAFHLEVTTTSSSSSRGMHKVKDMILIEFIAYRSHDVSCDTGL